MKYNPEQEKAQSVGRATGILVTLLLFLCIITVAFLSYQRSLDPSVELKDVLKSLYEPGEKEVKEAQVLHNFSFDAREKTAFVRYKDLLVKSSKSGIMFLDETGGIVRSESIMYSNPLIKTNGSLLLVADVGSTEISVLNSDTIRWQDKTEASILNADISEDGYVTVITSAKRDNNVIRVYEPHGIEIFRKIIANDYAVSASVSPSEKSLTVSSISTGAVGPFSRYKIYDMEGKEISELSFDETGELIPLFWHNRDDSLFAVGDSAVSYISSTGPTLWQEQFRSVAGAGMTGNGMLAVAAVSDIGAVLNVYKEDGQKHASTALQGRPEGLEAIKGRISVYNENEVFFFDDSGNNTSKYCPGKKIRQISLFSKNRAAVITDGEVIVLEMY